MRQFPAVFSVDHVLAWVIDLPSLNAGGNGPEYEGRDGEREDT